jgi:hypothetical protein
VPQRQNTLRRRRPEREPRKRFLLFCEGEVTEPDYFGGWRRFLRSRLIKIEISPERGDPLQLVQRAVSAKETAETQARRESDENLLYEEIWCVLDVDDHARLARARQVAQQHGIHLAVSEPCFELWGLLHYQDQWAYVECSAVGDALTRHLPHYDKRLDFDAIRPEYARARARAIALDERRTRNDGDSNPSTDVWRLVDSLCESRASGEQTHSQ